MIKTDTENRTYCGVPAEVTTYRLTWHAVRRVEVLLWGGKAVGQSVEHEAGTVELILMTGKSRRTVVRARKVLAPGATTEQIESTAQLMLENR